MAITFDDAVATGRLKEFKDLEPDIMELWKESQALYLKNSFRLCPSDDFFKEEMDGLKFERVSVKESGYFKAQKRPVFEGFAYSWGGCLHFDEFCRVVFLVPHLDDIWDGKLWLILVEGDLEPEKANDTVRIFINEMSKWHVRNCAMVRRHDLGK